MEPTRRAKLMQTGISMATIFALATALGVWFWPQATEPFHPRVRQGPDTVIALLVSSTCSVCSDESVMSAFREGLTSIVSQRSDSGRVRVLGVAVGTSPRRETQFLRRLGPFDEIAAGGGWVNFAFSELVWNQRDGVPAVPQLIMMVRQISIGDRRYSSSDLEITPLATGSDKIIAWLKEYTGST